MQRTKDLIVEVKEAKAPADTATAVWCSLLAVGGRWSLVVFFGGRRGDWIIDMVVAVACAFSSLAFWRCVPVQCVGGRGPLTAGALWAPRLRLYYLTLFDTNELIIYSIALLKLLFNTTASKIFYLESFL